jgi:hypothetical protein
MDDLLRDAMGLLGAAGYNVAPAIEVAGAVFSALQNVVALVRDAKSIGSEFQHIWRQTFGHDFDTHVLHLRTILNGSGDPNLQVQVCEKLSADIKKAMAEATKIDTDRQKELPEFFEEDGTSKKCDIENVTKLKEEIKKLNTDIAANECALRQQRFLYNQLDHALKQCATSLAAKNEICKVEVNPPKPCPKPSPQPCKRKPKRKRKIVRKVNKKKPKRRRTTPRNCAPSMGSSVGSWSTINPNSWAGNPWMNRF